MKKHIISILLLPFLMRAEQPANGVSVSTPMPSTINFNIHMHNTADNKEHNKVSVDAVQQIKETQQPNPQEPQQQISTVKWAFKCGAYFIGAISVAAVHAVAQGVTCGKIKITR